MNRPARFMIAVSLLSAFMAMSLSARAEEPRRPSREPRLAATHHELHHRFDPRHFDHRLWGLGRAYPYGCRWGRCGYWWWADGYWYFYAHPVYGPPEVVSEFAYDDRGNLVPIEAAVPLATMPPGPVAMPPPPPAAPNPVAGAVVGGGLGAIVGGALGRGPGAVVGAAVGATTGAVVAAEAQPRPGGYYWWRGACYYRYPNGAWSQPLAPNYCGY
jgi:hypothetical protein